MEGPLRLSGSAYVCQRHGGGFREALWTVAWKTLKSLPTNRVVEKDGIWGRDRGDNLGRGRLATASYPQWREQKGLTLLRWARTRLWLPLYAIWKILNFIPGDSGSQTWLPIRITYGSSCCSVDKLCPTLCDPHKLQHARLPCASLSPWVCSNSYPLSQWYYPTISSSVAPFSSRLNPSHNQGPFQSGSLHQMAKVSQL